MLRRNQQTYELLPFREDKRFVFNTPRIQLDKMLNGGHTVPPNAELTSPLHLPRSGKFFGVGLG